MKLEIGRWVHSLSNAEYKYKDQDFCQRQEDLLRLSIDWILKKRFKIKSEGIYEFKAEQEMNQEMNKIM